MAWPTGDQLLVGQPTRGRAPGGGHVRRERGAVFTELVSRKMKTNHSILIIAATVLAGARTFLSAAPSEGRPATGETNSGRLNATADRNSDKSRAGVRAPLPEANWPQFRGPGARGLGASSNLPEHWSATENVAWKAEIPGRGWSSPIVWGDRVFLTTAVSSGE